MATRRIHLVSVVGSYVEVLPHMLAHYRDMGIESVYVALHLEHAEDPARHRAEQIAREHGCGIHETEIGPWRPGTNPAIYTRIRSLHSEDWFLLADQDELQAYPEPLTEILGFCERHGYDYVEGCFLDRIARDGRLPPVRHDRPISGQFPLGGFLSHVLMSAYPRKIVAARGFVDIGWGQHTASGACGMPIDECFVPVHHFKWVEGLPDRLAARARARREMGEPYGTESQRFVDYYGRNGGRIDLDDAALLIADCTNGDHPHWERIREICRGI